jgi:glyoxylase-like metal-dependent hydrolase (beta-lactamase superfamily II)
MASSRRLASQHWDHAGGNAAIAAALPGLVVVGGALDAVEVYLEGR